MGDVTTEAGERRVMRVPRRSSSSSGRPRGTPDTRRRPPAAEAFRPLIDGLLGPSLPIGLRFWDGSALGPLDPRATIVVRSPDAIRRILTAPSEIGFGRAYVAGDLDVEGDLYEVLTLRDRLPARDGGASLNLGLSGWVRMLRGALAVRALGQAPAPPPEEARLSGRRHSTDRDQAAVRHHYDVSDSFYAHVLGETMTYSCAYFRQPEDSLDLAQTQKYELVCSKLGLRPGMRMLDMGCGWGGMVLHAASRHGVAAVGVTNSQHQRDLAAKRVADAGLTDRVEIRLADYREVDDGPYHAISSIGMYEHVGRARLEEYFALLYRLLAPGGRLLNHGISRPAQSPRRNRRSFIDRYVFPDGELHEVGRVVSIMQGQGFEVRDVESLREHYALTLRRWAANLERHLDEAQELVGPGRARIWRLYMAASALNFEAGRTNVHQVLGVRPVPGGGSGMPLARPAG